jgi:phosphatidylglycerol:prolipoprotein diacylglycerol transferase
VHPILFRLPFGLPVYGYGTMLCLSMLFGRLLAVRLAEREGMDPRLMGQATVWAMVSALVGCRLLFVAGNLDQFESLLDVVAWWKGGAVAYGGFIGGFAGTWVFCRRHRIPVLAWADCVAPALGLGLALTRVGCLLGGCDFGRPWDGPWAIRFPAGSPAFEQQAVLGLLPAGATVSLPVHPTQVYESLAGVILFLLTLAVRRHRTARGQAFVAFVIGYSIFRYAIEIVRGDLDRGSVGPFSTSQFIAIVTFLAAAALGLSLLQHHPDKTGVPKTV